VPTYTYVCDNCGNELEAFQSMSDEPLKRCPACKKSKLRRTFHPVGIVLKGSGFHKTDYRSTGKTSTTSGESSSDAKDSTSETKPETKAGSTTETKTSSDSKASTS
jgi:putative FmdB family regulatory protein